MCGLALAQSFVQASPLERIASLGQEVLSPRISRPMWLLRATPAKCSARSTNRTNSTITKIASSSKDDTGQAVPDAWPDRRSYGREKGYLHIPRALLHEKYYRLVTFFVK